MMAIVSAEKGRALLLAEAAQSIGSDPSVSAFVAASAGSGKTKLLTDRLLRLMLGGCPPGRILCLTFTRAAAAEMALRLQRRLGDWIRMADEALDAALAELGVAGGEEARLRARTLFAEVLDLPGGMRIGTIHAFCQSVLRRFPLEAALTPHFEVETDEDAAASLAEAARRVLAGADLVEVVGRLAPVLGSLDRLDGFLGALAHGRARTERLEALLPEARRRAFRSAAGASAAPPDRATLGDTTALRAALAAISGRGTAGFAARAEKALGWLGLGTVERRDGFEGWCGYFLTGTGEARKPGGMVNSVLARAQPAIGPVLAAEQRRLMDLLAGEVAERCAGASADLFSLALPVLKILGEEKALAGRLDYADLIRHTNSLLVDPGAAWVLYKLDGGVDHLLLDEAQDTAPEQWAIADALSAEFFAGEGAREWRRTVFAVGDPKQSIFSFQGADPAGFKHWRERFRARVEAAGEHWREPRLEVSFRSTEPVLALVDAVFADPAMPPGVGAPGQAMHHDPVRIGQAGAVELWPLAPGRDPPPAEPWVVPDENLNQGQVTAPLRLATALAAWIREETAGGVMLASRGRPLGAGDVLVLVRRRNVFSRALVRALKADGVPVAGLDRLALGEEPAVKDLLALCQALLLPDDDLTFAEFLVSPLGGLDDDDLMALAPGRPGALFAALRERASERERWQAAWDFFAGLRERADFIPPHGLLVRALGQGGGRRRLYARLGAEAAEPVDELLNAALRYEEAHPPSLQGFLRWFGESGAEIKREASEAAGGQVRVMTVHGAKGLEAPLVILPDTTGLPPPAQGLVSAHDRATGAAVPLFAPNADYRSEAVKAVRNRERQAAIEEHNRLLYVALTRAEDRLVVAGWEMKRGVAEECWYRLVERGFARLGAERQPCGLGWEGERLLLAVPQRAPPERERDRRVAPAPPLPEWAGWAPEWRARPPAAEPAR
ncbi:MAG: UvrD-helicase domain-containing protein, partial [Acetobacteraceae bacterium]